MHVGQRVKAVCTDGIVRSAVVRGEADTFFSVPASVRVGKKHVSGYLTPRENYNPEKQYETVYAFIAYSYRKNGYLLPGTEIPTNQPPYPELYKETKQNA